MGPQKYLGRKRDIWVPRKIWEEKEQIWVEKTIMPIPDIRICVFLSFIEKKYPQTYTSFHDWFGHENYHRIGQSYHFCRPVMVS